MRLWLVAVVALFLAVPFVQAQNCEEDEPNEVASEADELKQGDCRGRVGAGDRSAIQITNRVHGTAQLQDLWVHKAEVTTQLTVTMTFTDPDANLDMFLVTIAGNTTLLNAVATSEGETRTERINRRLGPGTYYLAIWSVEGLSDYVIKSVIQPVGPGCISNATTLCLNDLLPIFGPVIMSVRPDYFHS